MHCVFLQIIFVLYMWFDILFLFSRLMLKHHDVSLYHFPFSTVLCRKESKDKMFKKTDVCIFGNNFLCPAAFWFIKSFLRSTGMFADDVNEFRYLWNQLLIRVETGWRLRMKRDVFIRHCHATIKYWALLGTDSVANGEEGLFYILPCCRTKLCIILNSLVTQDATPTVLFQRMGGLKYYFRIPVKYHLALLTCWGSKRSLFFWKQNRWSESAI